MINDHEWMECTHAFLLFVLPLTLKIWDVSGEYLYVEKETMAQKLSQFVWWSYVMIPLEKTHGDNY